MMTDPEPRPGVRMANLPLEVRPCSLAAALEILGERWSLLALREGFLPPTINLREPDPACDLDYVPTEARPAEVETFLSNSFGFGGMNCVVAVRLLRQR